MSKVGQNKTIFFNLLSTVLLQGISFFSIPIFSRMLGTDNYGIASVCTTWAGIVMVVFPLAVGSSLSTASTKYSQKDFLRYQSSIMSLGLIAYAFFSICTIIFIHPISKLLNLNWKIILLILLHGYGYYAVGFASSKFIYEFKADQNFWLSLAVALGTTFLSLGLIYIIPSDNNYYGRILGNSVVYFIVGTVVVLNVLKQGRVAYNKEYWFFCLPLCLPIIFHSLSNVIIGQSDRVMLRSMGSDSMSGIYSLAYTFGSIISIIYNALNHSWAPFYLQYLKDNDRKELNRHIKYYLQVFTLLVIGYLFVYREVFMVFASRDYWEGITVIPIVVLGFYFIFLYSFSVNFEFFHKKTGFIACMTTLAACINIILNYILIQRAGMLGAAIASSLACFIEFILHYLYSSRGIKGVKLPFNAKLYLPYIGGVAAACIGYYVLEDSWIIRWGIGGIIGIYLIYSIIKRKTFF